MAVGMFNLLDKLTPKIPFSRLLGSPVGTGLYVFGYFVFLGLITNAALAPLFRGWMKKSLLFIWFLISSLFVSANTCFGMSSENFCTIKGEVCDDWNICRTRSLDNDGFFQILDKNFRPAIAFQSLGGLKDIAWRIGERLAESYSGNELAKRIFSYVRDNVVYTSDPIQFGFPEFARNADEIAGEIEINGYSRGDCEDYAVLLVVMFKAAGFRSSVVLAPDHAATLVYLPDYPEPMLIGNSKVKKDGYGPKPQDVKIR